MGSRLPRIGELEPIPEKRPKRHLPTGTRQVAGALLALGVGVVIGNKLAWILVVLALLVLALDLAGERRVQEYLPWVGRLPLVRDHRLQRPPALRRTTSAALSPRERERLALADEASQCAAGLIGLHERWDGLISGHGRVVKPPSAPIDESDTAVGKMLEQYHLEHRSKTLAIFERLVDQGVILIPDRKSLIKRPAQPWMVVSIAELLDEAAERLRLRNADLAAWLGERITEVKSLAADLREQTDRPVPDIHRVDVIHDGFWRLNGDVLQKLPSRREGVARLLRPEPRLVRCRCHAHHQRPASGGGSFLRVHGGPACLHQRAGELTCGHISGFRRAIQSPDGGSVPDECSAVCSETRPGRIPSARHHPPPRRSLAATSQGRVVRDLCQGRERPFSAIPRFGTRRGKRARVRGASGSSPGPRDPASRLA